MKGVPRVSLSHDDHALLLLLIRGESVTEASALMGITLAAATTRLERMRVIMEVRTTYQLIALEVIALMDSDEALPVPAVRAKTMAASG